MFEFISFCLRWLGVYAHTAERDWECNSDVKSDSCDDNTVDDIAEQLVYGPVGKHLSVIFGGGRTNFFDETEKDEQGIALVIQDGRWKNHLFLVFIFIIFCTNSPNI